MTKNKMKRENMKTNIKIISENLAAKPSKASQAFSTKLIFWSISIAFGGCLFIGVILFLYNNALQSKTVDLDEKSAIKRDPVSNSKSKSGNGSTVDMANANSSRVALNASDADLDLDAWTTLTRTSGKLYVFTENM